MSEIKNKIGTLFRDTEVNTKDVAKMLKKDASKEGEKIGENIGNGFLS